MLSLSIVHISALSYCEMMHHPASLLRGSREGLEKVRSTSEGWQLEPGDQKSYQVACVLWGADDGPLHDDGIAAGASSCRFNGNRADNDDSRSSEFD
jgi:hypothetical protein